MPPFLSLCLFDINAFLECTLQPRTAVFLQVHNLEAALQRCCFPRRAEPRIKDILKLDFTELGRKTKSQKITFSDKCFWFQSKSHFVLSFRFVFFYPLSQMLQSRMRRKSCRQNAACPASAVCVNLRETNQIKQGSEGERLSLPPCQRGRMPLIIGGDKWLSRVNPRVNKWRLCLFAQGFLHNKAEREDAYSLSEKARLLFYPDFVCPLLLLHRCSSQKSHVFICPGLRTDNKGNLVLFPLTLKAEVKSASANTVSPTAALDWILDLVVPGLDSV